MDWYTLANDLSTLKRLVAQGFLDYNSTTKAVKLLIKEVLGND